MVNEVSPERFLLNFPGASRGARKYANEVFRLMAEELFPKGLPDAYNGARFLSFGDGWKPITDKIRRPAQLTPPWVAKKVSP